MQPGLKGRRKQSSLAGGVGSRVLVAHSCSLMVFTFRGSASGPWPVYSIPLFPVIWPPGVRPETQKEEESFCLVCVCLPGHVSLRSGMSSLKKVLELGTSTTTGDLACVSH